MDNPQIPGNEPTTIGHRVVSMEVMSPSVSSVDASSVSNVNLCCLVDMCGASCMIRISFLANLVLFIVKIYIFIVSGSLSVLASLIDSSVDLLAQGVLMAVNRYVERPRSAYETYYPAGVSRMEPVGVLICAIIMSIGAIVVMKDAIVDLVSVYLSGKEMPKIEIDTVSLAFLLSLIILKLLLYILCLRLANKGNVTLNAVAQDHRNDVASNGVALIAAGIVAKFPQTWVVDPIGALLIGVWIIRAWSLTAREQANLLVGKAADPKFLEIVREIAETHDSAACLDVVRAYHFGPKFLVEIEMVMAPSTSLIESHDVGILLQHKIECLEDCERCFVHIDYQTREINDHDPGIPVEQKIRSAEAEGLIQRHSRSRP